MFQDSVCICYSHLPHQRNRTRRKLFFQSCLQDPLEACFVVLSGDESCPVRAKIRHSDFRSLVCSHPNRGRNQPSHPVSSGTLSTPHRLLFGHRTHQRLQCYQGRWCKHRLFVHHPCRLQHNSCKLKMQNEYSLLTLLKVQMRQGSTDIIVMC